MFDFGPADRTNHLKPDPAEASADAVRQLLKEAREENQPAAASSGSSPERHGGASSFAPGTVVQLVGLQSKPELNGRRGRLLALDKASGRWQVKLKDGTKLFKVDNLVACAAEQAPKQTPAPRPAAAERRRKLPEAPLSPEEAVEWVNNASDEFEALMLPLQLEEDPAKIRKQYRQLSLLVHPDKNQHKDAEAAFKKLFGAMQRLSDPMQQRVALRQAKQMGGAALIVDDSEGGRWWEQATVDEMEKSFREMEERYEKMGFYQLDKRMVAGASGVDEDQLWASPEFAKDLLDKDLAIFLDSRNTTDFDVSHVCGAHSLPGHTMEQLATIEQTKAYRLVLENPEQTVIVYSDNGSKLSRCVHVARALRLREGLQAQRVLRLSGGLNLWKRNGFPVEGDPRALFAGQVLGSSMMRLG